MLDILTNAPKKIQFGGRTFQVGALKLKELGLLQRWIREHAVRPYDKLREVLEFADEEEKRKLKYEATVADKAWPPRVSSAQGDAILFEDPDGQVYFLSVMLRKYQPELTDNEIDEITKGLSEVDFMALIRIAFGEDDLDPKEARASILASLRLRNAERTATGSESSSLEGGTDPIGARSSADSGPNPLT